MNQALEGLDKLVKMLKADGSTDYKKQVLAKYGVLSKGLLAKIYNKQLPFHITSRNVDYNPTAVPDGPSAVDIHLLLHNLANRVWTGDKALYEVSAYISRHSKYKELICDIIDKDLKCGISTKTINAVWPGLIFDFNSRVPLANKYDPKLVDFENENWYASRKVDGVRCLCFITRNDIKFYSRNGKEFFTLERLRSDVACVIGYGTSDIILDGEICLVDEDGNENFQDVMKEIRRKDHVIKKPKFFVFDVYSIGDFETGGDEKSYIPTQWLQDCELIELLHHTKIKSFNHLEGIINSIPASWEGVMLRKDPTQFKRSNSLLKIKKFKEAEYHVMDYTWGEKYIDEARVVCLSAVQIVHKDNTVSVGSGFTDQERIRYFIRPEEIVGKVITVKYFEETVDQNGKYSLRFPIFKGVRDYE